MFRCDEKWGQLVADFNSNLTGNVWLWVSLFEFNIFITAESFWVGTEATSSHFLPPFFTRITTWHSLGHPRFSKMSHWKLCVCLWLSVLFLMFYRAWWFRFSDLFLKSYFFMGRWRSQSCQMEMYCTAERTVRSSPHTRRVLFGAWTLVLK